MKRARRFLSMALVQRTELLDKLGNDLAVRWHLFSWGICKIGEQGDLKIRVAVGQPVSFALLDKTRDLCSFPDQGGDDDNRLAAGRKPFGKIQLWQCLGGNNQRRQTLDQGNGQGRCRDQHDQERADPMHWFSGDKPQVNGGDEEGADPADQLRKRIEGCGMVERQAPESQP